MTNFAYADCSASRLSAAAYAQSPSGFGRATFATSPQLKATAHGNDQIMASHVVADRHEGGDKLSVLTATGLTMREGIYCFPSSYGGLMSLFASIDLWLPTFDRDRRVERCVDTECLLASDTANVLR